MAENATPAFVANFFGEKIRSRPQNVALATIEKKDVVYNWSGINPIANKSRS